MIDEHLIKVLDECRRRKSIQDRIRDIIKNHTAVSFVARGIKRGDLHEFVAMKLDATLTNDLVEEIKIVLEEWDIYESIIRGARYYRGIRWK